MHRLYVERLATAATEPFELIRESAEIDLIEDPKRHQKESRNFNKRRVERLRSAVKYQAALRDLLELDGDDELEPPDVEP